MNGNQTNLDASVLTQMRAMAGAGKRPSAVFEHLRRSLGEDVHVGTVLLYFREAFNLPLSEVKPVAALTRNDKREITDPARFDDLVGCAIERHRPEWNAKNNEADIAIE